MRRRTGESAKVYQTGDIVAGKAYGPLHYAPNTAVGVVVDTDFAGAYADIAGNLSVTGYDSATGVHAVSAIFGSHITVYGEMNVMATTGAGNGVVTGIDMTSSGLGQARLYGDLAVGAYTGVNASSAGPSYGVRSLTVGSGTVGVYGNLSAIAGGDTSGLHIISYYYGANGRVSGDLSAVSRSGSAIGAYAHARGAFFNYGGRAGGAANLTVGGQVDVTGQAGATGLEAYSYARAANITAGGVNVHAQTGAAIGAEAQAYTSAYVHVTGPVYARSTGAGSAIGVYAQSGTSGVSDVVVDGNVRAFGIEGAQGVIAGGGNVNIHIGQDVEASTAYGDAFGVRAAGDQYVFIGGNASAYSLAGNATAASATGTGYQGVHVGAHVYAGTNSGNATGLDVESSGAGASATVYVGNGVYALSRHGNATGVYGNVAGVFDAEIYGLTDAYAPHGTAIGVKVLAPDLSANVDIHTGDIVAVGLLGATGVYVHSGDQVYISTGNVSVAARYGYALGLGTVGRSQVYSNVRGDVTVTSVYGSATGVSAAGTGRSYAYAGGDVRVYAGQTATGMKATTYGSLASVIAGENVSATSNYGRATAIYAENSNAAGTTHVYVGGNVFATAYDNASGVFVNAQGAADVSIAHSVDIQATHGAAYGVNIFARGDAASYVGGGIFVDSAYSYATGVQIFGEKNVGIGVGGDVSVSAAKFATGIFAGGIIGYDTNVYVGGNVTVSGYSGASGVTALGGNVTVEVEGRTKASSYLTGATGVFVATGGADTVTVAIGGSYAYSRQRLCHWSADPGRQQQLVLRRGQRRPGGSVVQRRCVRRRRGDPERGRGVPARNRQRVGPGPHWRLRRLRLRREYLRARGRRRGRTYR